MTDAAAAVRAAKYVLLTTFKRDGTPVATAVWAVSEGDDLLIWTGRNTGKVKRIRRSGDVTLAPCTSSGRPTGDTVAGSAVLLDTAGTIAVQQALIGKYGWLARLFVGRALRRGGQESAIGIRVTIDG
jgi:PPOX class probable F420-dependent enzyme